MKTVVIISDDPVHSTAIKNTIKEKFPLICFVEARDSTAIFDFLKDAGQIDFTPDLIILDIDLQIFVGKNILHLLHDAFGTGCSILLLAQEGDLRCRLYRMLYGINILYKTACARNYPQALEAILPASVPAQVQ